MGLYIFANHFEFYFYLCFTQFPNIFGIVIVLCNLTNNLTTSLSVLQLNELKHRNTETFVFLCLTIV